MAAFFAGGVTGAAIVGALLGRPAPRVVYVDRPAAQAMDPAERPLGDPLIPAVATDTAVATNPAAAGDPVATRAVAPSAASDKATQPSALAGRDVLAAAPIGTGSRARATSPASTPRASQLAAERLLLDEARAGLVQDSADRALEKLAEHAARFPAGLLAEERDAMRVEALVRAGRYAEARARADAFRQAAPKSLFLATVDSAVASIP